MGRKPLVVGEATKNVVELLRARMDGLGMSGRELARRAGITATRCRDLLAGERPLMVDELEDMADALGLVGWVVLREAELAVKNPVRVLSVAPAMVEGPDESLLAADRSEEENEQ